MKKVYVFLAEGFEEVEALTVIDLLRRADIEVVSVSITGENHIKGAHDIGVTADRLFEDLDYKDGCAFVLPGGMPGTKHLADHKGLDEILRTAYDDKKYLAAICAAPLVFGKKGFLKKRKAICFPGFEEELLGAEIVEAPVVIDDFIVTSKGLGTAIEFSLALISIIVNQAKAKEVKSSIQYNCKS